MADYQKIIRTAIKLAIELWFAVDDPGGPSLGFSTWIQPDYTV